MHIAQNWRMNGQRYSLKGIRCETCGKTIFPARDVCPHCQGQVKRTAEVIAMVPASMERAAR
jgi:uncharacterized OB-fold protein